MAQLRGTANTPLQTPASYQKFKQREETMDPFEIIQHPLDWLSLTGSMAKLDERGRESAEQLLTMIGDLQFCKEDIRGTCARYFIFIETEWFCKLCVEANIDSKKLQNYLLSITEGKGKLHKIFDDPQLSFCFPKSGEPLAGAHDGLATARPGIQHEALSENNRETERGRPGSGPSIQKPASKSIRGSKKRERAA